VEIAMMMTVVAAVVVAVVVLEGQRGAGWKNTSFRGDVIVI